MHHDLGETFKEAGCVYSREKLAAVGLQLEIDACSLSASEFQNPTTGKINVERLRELIPLVQRGALKLVPIEGWDPKTKATHRRKKHKVSEGSSAAAGTYLSKEFVNDDDDEWSVRPLPLLFCYSQLLLF